MIKKIKFLNKDSVLCIIIHHKGYLIQINFKVNHKKQYFY